MDAFAGDYMLGRTDTEKLILKRGHRSHRVYRRMSREREGDLRIHQALHALGAAAITHLNNYFCTDQGGPVASRPEGSGCLATRHS